VSDGPDHITAHVLRPSFTTTLVRGGTDLIITAELLGHARLETTRVSTHPTGNVARGQRSPGRSAPGGSGITVRDS
jgi:site-specific recombinase XerD